MSTDLLRFKEELSKELNDNILNYWKKNTIDNEHGGFIGSIDGSEIANSKAPKGLVLNTRIIWTFSSAYRLQKKQEDLDTATRAFEYFKAHFIDKVNGGAYWELDYLGNPLNPRKQIYGLSFAIYGLAEYYRACKDESALEIAIAFFKLIEKYSLDVERNGYVEALTQDWQAMDDYRLSEKDANESKTMNTHLHIMEAYTNLFRVWKDKTLESALNNIITLYCDRFVNDNYNLNLFFDDDWNLKSDEISYGHDIECSWLLHESAEVLGDSLLLHRVEEIAINMAEVAIKGLDADGGMLNENHPSKNHIDTDKHWWPQAEAVVGFYNAYQISGKAHFLDRALGSWNFIKNFVVDKEHGEWYGRLNKAGIPYKGDEKAGFWKCPYHNGRTCMELIERLEKTL